MTDPDNMPLPPPPPRSGCLTALMVVAGIILLFPGLCALLFGGGSLIEQGRIESDVLAFVLVGLLAGAGGIALLRAVIRGRRG